MENLKYKNQNSKFKIAAIALLALAIISLPISSARAGSYWATGMGIGVVVGGLGTGISVYAASSDNSSCEDTTECEGLRRLGSFVVGLGGAIAGGVIGAGIGASIKKEGTDSHWGKGLLIGALVGGAGLALATVDTKDGDTILLAGIMGAIPGGIMGASIGSLIEKEPKVTIVPTISPSQNGGATYGLGINGRF